MAQQEPPTIRKEMESQKIRKVPERKQAPLTQKKRQPRPMKRRKKKRAPGPQIVEASKPAKQEIKNISRSSKVFREEEVILQDQDGNIYPDQVVVYEGKGVILGDIYVEDIEKIQRLQRQDQPLRLTPGKTWPEGVIPYLIDNNLPQQNTINQAVQELNEKTNLFFRPRKIEDENWVLFSTAAQHCFSAVGMRGGEQKIYLSENCGRKEILHEMMHTIGFYHEQNRPNRDDYVFIYWENIETQYRSQFKIIPKHLIDLGGRPFAFDSIMMYPPHAFSRYPDDYSMSKLDGTPYQTSSGSLSLEDLTRINLAYPDLSLEKIDED